MLLPKKIEKAKAEGEFREKYGSSSLALYCTHTCYLERKIQLWLYLIIFFPLFHAVEVALTRSRSYSFFKDLLQISEEQILQFPPFMSW